MMAQVHFHADVDDGSGSPNPLVLPVSRNVMFEIDGLAWYFLKQERGWSGRNHQDKR
jgi:hypothetical protein